MRLVPVHPHHGDGEFTDISRRYFGLPIQGYRIEFPEFDLSTNCDTCYRISSVPDIGVDTILLLGIKRPDGRLYGGQLKLRIDAILESDGIVIARIMGKPDDFIRGGWDNADRWYQIPGSRFRPNLAASYTLRLRFTGDGNLSGAKEHLCIESGGHP